MKPCPHHNLQNCPHNNIFFIIRELCLLEQSKDLSDSSGGGISHSDIKYQFPWNLCINKYWILQQNISNRMQAMTLMRSSNSSQLLLQLDNIWKSLIKKGNLSKTLHRTWEMHYPLCSHVFIGTLNIYVLLALSICNVNMKQINWYIWTLRVSKHSPPQRWSLLTTHNVSTSKVETWIWKWHHT